LFAFFVVFLFGWILGHNNYNFSRLGFNPKIINQENNSKSVDFGIFWRAWDLLEKKYDGKLDYQKMIYGAIKGMTESLGDPYTTFLTPEEAKAFEDELSGSISGIGAEVGIKNGKLTVISPIDDSPAKKAGIQSGDHIAMIEDEATDGMSVSVAVSKIRGEAGTKVRLKIIRAKEVKDFEITRTVFTVKSVKSEIVQSNIGHISITRFDEKTPQELRNTLEDYEGRNVKNIVLDLRDNPGGYLDSSIKVASEFVRSGVIVSEKNEISDDETKKYKATGKGVATDKSINLVILINQGSASASEIVAGALRDHGRAILVGDTTYGKGSVQKLENLSGGAELRLTIAHWYTPNGKNITKDGIKPDYEIKMTDEDYNKDIDPQLNKAIELLRKKEK